MDAREQLRRYLEQRREAGETELVLDGMTVEDVMRLLGAGAAAGRDAVDGGRYPIGAPRSRRARSRAPRGPSPEPAIVRERPAASGGDGRPAGDAGSTSATAPTSVPPASQRRGSRRRPAVETCAEPHSPLDQMPTGLTDW